MSCTDSQIENIIDKKISLLRELNKDLVNLEELLEKHKELLRRTASMPENADKGFFKMTVLITNIDFEREYTFQDMARKNLSMSQIEKTTPLCIENGNHARACTVSRNLPKRKPCRKEESSKSDESFFDSSSEDDKHIIERNIKKVPKERVTPVKTVETSDSSSEDDITKKKVTKKKGRAAKPKPLKSLPVTDNGNVVAKPLVSENSANVLSDVSGTADSTNTLSDVPGTADSTNTLSDVPGTADSTNTLSDVPGTADSTNTLSDVPGTVDHTSMLSSIDHNQVALDSGQMLPDLSTNSDDIFESDVQSKATQEFLDRIMFQPIGNIWSDDEEDDDVGDIFQDENVDHTPSFEDVSTSILKPNNMSSWEDWIEGFKIGEEEYNACAAESINVLCFVYGSNEEWGKAINNSMTKWIDSQNYMDPWVRDLVTIQRAVRDNQEYVQTMYQVLHDFITIRLIGDDFYNLFFHDYYLYQDSIDWIVHMLQSPKPPERNTIGWKSLWEKRQENIRLATTLVSGAKTRKRSKEVPQEVEATEMKVLEVEPMKQFRTQVTLLVGRQLREGYVIDKPSVTYHEVCATVDDFIDMILVDAKTYKNKTCPSRLHTFIKRLRQEGVQPTTGEIEGYPHLSHVPFWIGLDKTRNWRYLCIILELIAKERGCHPPFTYLCDGESLSITDHTPENGHGHMHYFHALIGGPLAFFLHKELLAMRENPSYYPIRALRISLTLYYIGGCRIIGGENFIIMPRKCFHKLMHILRLTDDVVGDQADMIPLMNSLQKDAKMIEHDIKIQNRHIEEGLFVSNFGILGSRNTIQHAAKHQRDGKLNRNVDPEKMKINYILHKVFDQLEDSVKAAIPRIKTTRERFGTFKIDESTLVEQTTREPKERKEKQLSVKTPLPLPTPKNVFTVKTQAEVRMPHRRHNYALQIFEERERRQAIKKDNVSWVRRFTTDEIDEDRTIPDPKRKTLLTTMAQGASPKKPKKDA